MNTKSLLAVQVLSLMIAPAVLVLAQDQGGDEAIKAFKDGGCATAKEERTVTQEECDQRRAAAKPHAMRRLEALADSPEEFLAAYAELAPLFTDAERKNIEGILRKRPQQEASAPETPSLPEAAATVDHATERLRDALRKPLSSPGAFDGSVIRTGAVPFVALGGIPSEQATPPAAFLPLPVIGPAAVAGGLRIPVLERSAPPSPIIASPVSAIEAEPSASVVPLTKAAPLDEYAAQFPFSKEEAPKPRLSPGEAAVSAVMGLIGYPTAPDAKVTERTVSDVSGAKRPGTLAVFPDGSTSFKSLVGGLTIRTTPNGHRVREDKLRGEYLEEVHGRTTAAWTRDAATGETIGSFHDVKFTAAKGHDVIFSDDRKKLYIVNGKNAKGEPNVVQIVEDSGISTVRIRESLPRGETLRVEGQDGRTHYMASIDPSREVPWDSIRGLEPKQAKALKGFLADLPKLFPAVRTALILGDHQSAEVRDGQLSFAVNTGGHGAYEPMQVVADTVGEGDSRNTRAFLFTQGERYMLDFGRDGNTMRMRRRDGPKSESSGRNEYVDYRTYAQVDGVWKVETATAPALETTPAGTFVGDLSFAASAGRDLAYEGGATLGAGTLNVIGTGGKVLFSIPQTAVSGLQAIGMKAEAGRNALLAPESFDAAWWEFQQNYTVQQATLIDAVNWMRGVDMETQEGRRLTYESSMGRLLPESRRAMEAYLDYRVNEEREKDPEGMLHRNGPVEGPRIRKAAEIFGGMKVAHESFKLGQEYIQRGGGWNVATGVALDAVGVVDSFGRMFLEGSFASAFMAPLKIVGLKTTGLLTAEEAAVTGRVMGGLKAGEHVFPLLADDLAAFAKGAGLLGKVNKAEMRLMLTPVLASGAQNAKQFITGVISGESEKAWEGFNGLLGDLPGLVGLKEGLRRGHGGEDAAQGRQSGGMTWEQLEARMAPQSPAGRRALPEGPSGRLAQAASRAGKLELLHEMTRGRIRSMRSGVEKALAGGKLSPEEAVDARLLESLSSGLRLSQEEVLSRLEKGVAEVRLESERAQAGPNEEVYGRYVRARGPGEKPRVILDVRHLDGTESMLAQLTVLHELTHHSFKGGEVDAFTAHGLGFGAVKEDMANHGRNLDLSKAGENPHEPRNPGLLAFLEEAHKAVSEGGRDAVVPLVRRNYDEDILDANPRDRIALAEHDLARLEPGDPRRVELETKVADAKLSAKGAGVPLGEPGMARRVLDRFGVTNALPTLTDVRRPFADLWGKMRGALDTNAVTETAAEQRAAAAPAPGPGAYASMPRTFMNFVEAFYAKTGRAATPEALSRLNGDKTSEAHPAWWSDHGPDHVRNIVENISSMLGEAQRSGLIEQRSGGRADFMDLAGRANAAMHDMWMMDLTAKGRKLHPARAARESFNAKLDAGVRDLSAMPSSDGRPFSEVLTADYGVPAADVPRVMREVMAMSYAHSKSNVPLEVLNNPSRLREAMLDVTSSRDAATRNFMAAEGHSGETLPGGGKPYRRFYEGPGGNEFEAKAFDWIENNPKLSADMTDVARSLRAADALRWRGAADFRGSQGSNIGIARLGGDVQAYMRLSDPKTGKTYMVLYDSPLGMGEANVRSARLTKGGGLAFSLESGDFGSKAADGKVAAGTAHVILDVFKDYAGSFNGTDNRRIELQRPAREAPGFSESVIERLVELARKEKDPSFARDLEARLADGRLSITRAPEADPAVAAGKAEARRIEAERYAAGRPYKPEEAAVRTLRRMVESSGADTSAVDFNRALEGARVIGLRPGEELLARGSESAFVYVPLSGGLSVRLGEGYKPAPIRPGVPVGELSAVTEAPRNADIMALEAGTPGARASVQVLAIPRETYLREWTKGYYNHDNIIPRLKKDYGRGSDASGRAGPAGN